MKNFKVIYYIAALFIAGIVTLVYLSKDQSIETEPKIKLSYFKSNREVAELIYKTLESEIKQESYFWFGVEPGHSNQLEILKELKTMIENDNGAFEIIMVDEELKLSEAEQSLFGASTIQQIKEHWGKVAEDIKNHAEKKILVVSAAVYTTNLIKENPIHKINEAAGIKPTTFSLGYFSMRPEDEKKSTFPCVTDDKEGVAAWGCLVLNKARSQRRKVDPSKSSPCMMDQTGEKDYMVLVR